jgi:hypothetical protein
MRGAILHAPRDIRVEQREDPKIEQPTDAIIRLAATCVCGSDLWSYRGIEPVSGPAPMGHEYAGIVDEILLLRPGVWHGYQECQRFEVYTCCFSSELLRRELCWTREDPLLGFLLWAGPYSSPGRGVLTISLPPSVLGECLAHLDALAALRHRPPCTGPTSSAACRSCSASLARPSRRPATRYRGNPDQCTPPSCRRCACSKPTLPATGR